VRTLLAAWGLCRELPLKIAGCGPLEEELQNAARAAQLPVEFLGYRGREELDELIGRAVMVVVPSECYEGFPMVVLEALACGTPMVASRLGSLAEVVVEGITGVHFTAGDPDQLAAAVQHLRADHQVLTAMRYRCRTHFNQHYTAEHAIVALQEIYTAVRREAGRRPLR
jgi:glycosyltransferase involved in cell wall biosynthesis